VFAHKFVLAARSDLWKSALEAANAECLDWSHLDQAGDTFAERIIRAAVADNNICSSQWRSSPNTFAPCLLARVART
jgi:hypothetical protein